VRQSTSGRCSRNAASAPETSVTSVMPAKHRESHRMELNHLPHWQSKARTDGWFHAQTTGAENLVALTSKLS
jgi:hypothetical protein